MEKKIWQYWEGPCPDYIKLCLETVRKNAGAPVHVLGRADFDRLLAPYSHLDFSRLTPVQRSDVVRSVIVRNEGGLYIDADCVVLKQLDYVFDVAEFAGCCVVAQEDGEIQTNFLCARPESGVVAALLDGIFNTLQSGGNLAWLDLATVPLVQAVSQHPDEIFLLPTDLIAPIHWSEPERLIQQAQETDHANNMNEDALCYMLSNDTMKSREDVRFVTALPRDTLLSGSYFLSYLFRRAFA